MLLLAPSILKDFVSRLFVAAGAPPFDAECVADSLVESSLRGYDSHGVALARWYLSQIKNGELMPGAPFSVLHETPALVTADGNLGFGQVQCGRLVRFGPGRYEQPCGVDSVFRGTRNDEHGREPDRTRKRRYGHPMFVSPPAANGPVRAPFRGAARGFSEQKRDRRHSATRRQARAIRAGCARAIPLDPQEVQGKAGAP